jgi:hypothetical protein
LLILQLGSWRLGTRQLAGIASTGLLELSSSGLLDLSSVRQRGLAVPAAVFFNVAVSPVRQPHISAFRLGVAAMSDLVEPKWIRLSDAGGNDRGVCGFIDRSSGRR